jgi:hypothetical protein
MLTWINAGCDVGLGLPKCGAMHPTSVPGQIQSSHPSNPTSAILSEADVSQGLSARRNGPKHDIAGLVYNESGRQLRRP